MLAGLSACQIDSNSAGPATPILIQEIPSPAVVGGAPNLFVSEDKQIVLSWVEYLNDTTDALLFSRLEHDQWSTPHQIARGSDWFVNWADFPSVATFNDASGSIAAHWLQKSAEGTYDYDVRVAISNDGGQVWSPSFIPHRDKVNAEHGFVTLLPLQNGNIFAAWLDGRHTKDSKAHNDGHNHGHGGAMTIRTAEFDNSGNLYQEAELDARVCDCCQTDAVLTDSGPVVVYRDRSDEEVRDISIVRQQNGEWTKPRTIHQDNWTIAGCPVNGPAITAQGNAIAIAWFTAPDNENQVNVIFSSDAGKTFSDPIRIDDGAPIGRVDVVFTEPNHALVSWVEKIGDNGEIRLAKVTPTGKIGASMIATQTSLSRESGFPILEHTDQNLILTWTAVDSITTIKTASLQL